MADSINKINCLVVDDEPLALELLSDYVAKVPELNLTKATSDPHEALQLAKTGTVDLVFLDMQLPEMSGLQFMKVLQKRCMVIITTAYSEYAIEGYENNVVDYLLKPITIDRFMIAVDKAIERTAKNNGTIGKETSMTNETAYVFVKTEYRIVKIFLSEILYLEGARDYIIIHTLGEPVLTLQSLKSLEELLPGSQFMRVHKSYIISLGKINFIERSRISIGLQLIPISDTYRSILYKHLKIQQ